MEASLLEQKQRIDDYLRLARPTLATSSFVNIFAWKDFFTFDLQMIEGALCVFARHETGEFLYLPPLGAAMTPSMLDACFDRMEEVNGGRGVGRVENADYGQLRFFDPARFIFFQKGYEYVYYRTDIAGLRGNLYKSKRCAYNQFARQPGHAYRPYEDGMCGECLRVYDAWARDRLQTHVDPVYRQMVEENRKVHEQVLCWHKELGMTGRVVTVGERIAGYTFGFALTPETFCVFLETTDLAAKGAAVFIFKEFCSDAFAKPYKFINVMDDFALANIQRVKMSFAPSVLSPSYTVTRRKS